MNVSLLFILHYSKIRNYLRDNIILSHKQRIVNNFFDLKTSGFRPRNRRFSTSEPNVFDLKTSCFRPRSAECRYNLQKTNHC